MTQQSMERQFLDLSFSLDNQEFTVSGSENVLVLG